MKVRLTLAFVYSAALLICTTITVGCADVADGPPTGETASAKSADHDHDHDHDEHDEGHHGPHHGHLIELGRSHEYHAELVEDLDRGILTVYILDKDLKEVPIDAKTVTMNLTMGGEAKTFELAAVDVQNGKASRFEAGDEAIVAGIHKNEATGKLRVAINGTPYSGEVGHHHDDETVECKAHVECEDHSH